MRCFLQLFAPVIWRNTANCSNEQIRNAVKLRGFRISKSLRAILLSISFLLYSLVPVSLLAAGEPPIPDTVTASDGTFLDIVRINWADVADETEYQVFRCATMDTVTCGNAIATLPADTNQYDDIDADNIGGKHYYRLMSCNGNGCIDFSSADIGYTQRISGNGYEDDDVTIKIFTVNGATEVTLTNPPNGPVNLDWSTSSAENCKASSTPNLDDWNTTVSISTYGPKSVQLPEIVNSYSLGLSCRSALGLEEVSRYVVVTVGNVPEAPFLDSAIAGNENVELAFTPNGDGSSDITGFTAKCGAVTQNGSSSPITVDGLTNGVAYSCSVTATNVMGNSEPSNVRTVIPKTNPDAPTLLSATAGDASAELTFTPNGDGGSNITGYTATCGGTTRNGVSSPITVSGLTNGVEYSCTVIATNEVDDSTPSSDILVTPMTFPEAPTLLFATPGDESVELTFTPNNDGGSDITGYTAACGGVTQRGASSPIMMSGLTNGVEYLCSVIATNEVDDSNPSDAILVTPAKASITEFEITTNRDPQPISCGDTNIEFSWKATNVDHCYGTWMESGNNLDGLLVGFLDPENNTLFHTESVLFDDLARSKEFTLKCANERDVIVAEESQLVDVKAPCLTTNIESWNSVFTRDWPAPKSYTTNIRITGDKAWAIKFNTGPVVSKTSTSSPITIAGLQRGAQYSCSVKANNANGSSSPSNLLYFNPVELFPEAPTLVSATAGDGSATLAFTARDDLFEITSYTAKCGNYTQTGSSSPITVNNLSNGSGYYCSVTARNEMGIGQESNELPITPQVSALFVASVKGDGGTFQVSPGTSGTSATGPSAPTLISSERGHLSTELAFTDNVPAATSYTASCRISTLSGVGTIEFGSTRGARLIAVSRFPGNFQVADECKVTQYLDGFLYVKTEGSDYNISACDLEPNKDYYWNITFTDGINTGTSSCAGTPCQTYLRTVNPDTVN
jgi:hypothetical protein